MITAARARELLSYNPETGAFVRIAKNGRRGGRPVGGAVGGRGGHSYVRVSVDGRRYYGHHIAWLMHYGEWPVGVIDHADGNGFNNAITNLRVCKHVDNSANAKRSRGNTSGFKGVSRRKDTGKFTAYINRSGERRSLGCYDTAEAAHAAYLAAAAELFGPFVRAA